MSATVGHIFPGKEAPEWPDRSTHSFIQNVFSQGAVSVVGIEDRNYSKTDLFPAFKFTVQRGIQNWNNHSENTDLRTVMDIAVENYRDFESV